MKRKNNFNVELTWLCEVLKVKYDKIFWILQYIIINKKKLSIGITNNKAVNEVTSLTVSAHHLIEDLSPPFTR